VKKQQVAPLRVGLNRLEIPIAGRIPFSSRRKMLVMRRDNCPATCHKVIRIPVARSRTGEKGTVGVRKESIISLVEGRASPPGLPTA